MGQRRNDAEAGDALFAVPGAFAPLPLGSVRAEGWLLDRLRRDVSGCIGRLDELCDEVTLDVYDTARVTSDRPGSWWNGESTGNWLDGLVRLAHVVGDADILGRANECVDRLLATQDADGYLGVYSPSLRWATTGPSGELFCQSRVLSVLLGHHEATGRADVRDAAVRAAGVILANCSPGDAGHYFSSGPDRGVDGGRAHGVLLVDQMLAIARLTGDRRFGDFAVRCYEDYSFSGVESAVEWCYSDCKLPNLLDDVRPFVGHGPHTVEHLRIPLALYHWTGDPRYLAAHVAGHRKLDSCLGVSGACKSDEWIGMRALGGAVVPPIPESGYEYCTITELALTLQTALAWTGDGSFADKEERLVFNAAEAARAADGLSVAYLAADNQYRAAAASGRRWKYSPTHADVAVCCVPNAGRVLPSHVSQMVMRPNGGGVAVVFYGPSQADVPIHGGTVRVVQRTGYPYADDVLISLDMASPVQFPLWLRVPGWAATMDVVVGGADVPFRTTGAFRVIDRVWHPGDEVAVRFAAHVDAVRAPDGTTALRRGPLVFALPVENEATVTKRYPNPAFVDVDLEPVAGARWDYTLLLDRHGGAAHATVHRREGCADPLSSPPVEIEVPALDAHGDPHLGTTVTPLRLVPIGCTSLRRTSFSAVRAYGDEAFSTDSAASGDDLAGT